PQPGQCVGGRHRSSLVKLLLPLSVVRGSAHNADDPLSRVASQVQEKVADAVGFRARPPPHIVIGQLFQAPFDPGKMTGSQECAGLIDKRLCDAWHRERSSTDAFAMAGGM